jgi:hypothetical protein
VGSLGTDGQYFLSSGAGKSATYEAAAGGFDVSSITGATALAAEPDYTDELVVSDAGTLKRVDAKHFLSGPVLSCFSDNSASETSVDHNTYTIAVWKRRDTMHGGTWAVSSGSSSPPSLGSRWTPGVAGWYINHINHRLSGGPPAKLPDDGEHARWIIYKNGSAVENRGTMKIWGYTQVLIGNGSGNHNSHDFRCFSTGMIYLDDDDYIEMYSFHDGGGTISWGQYNQWTCWRAAGFGN